MQTKADPSTHMQVSRRTVIKALKVNFAVPKSMNKDYIFLSIFLSVPHLCQGTLTPGGRQALGKRSLGGAKRTVLTELNSFASGFTGTKKNNKIKKKSVVREKQSP